MPIFNQQRLEDPEKWKSHYSFGGALLLGLSFETPGQLALALSATKGTNHPALAGLNDIARSALPRDAFLSTVRISCSGVRELDWTGNPAVLSAARERGGNFGAIRSLEVAKADGGGWTGVLTGDEFELEWTCDAASLREGA